MRKGFVLVLASFCVLLLGALGLLARQNPAPPPLISYTVDVRHSTLKLYWKDANNQRFRSLQGLKAALATKGQQLLFAMNAGMFKSDFSPLGLFIQDQQMLVPLDTATGPGNFYLQPNGVFYITASNTAHICKTEDFRNDGRVAYATQSGPMLVTDGAIHPAFRPGSTNLQIRNGVGILPGHRVLLAMSTTAISFYDFAAYFQRAGCQQALYLDGYVSSTYAPAAGWTQLDGNFGVIIGVTAPQQPPRLPGLPPN